MVHALQHAQTALLVQPSSPRYLRSTHISYTDPSSIANPRRVYFPGARPMFKDERDGTLRTFDEIDPKEGFSDAQADFTELAELNDVTGNATPPQPRSTQRED